MLFTIFCRGSTVALGCCCWYHVSLSFYWQTFLARVHLCNTRWISLASSFIPQVRNISSCKLLQSPAGPPLLPTLAVIHPLCRSGPRLPSPHHFSYSANSSLYLHCKRLLTGQEQACSSITQLVFWALFGQKETHPAPFLPDKQREDVKKTTFYGRLTKRREWVWPS